MSIKLKDMLAEEIKEGMSPQKYDRMESVVNLEKLKIFKKVFPSLVKGWREDGFSQKDIVDYVSGIGGFSLEHPFYVGK
jgi:hypothetical protein